MHISSIQFQGLPKPKTMPGAKPQQPVFQYIALPMAWPSAEVLFAGRVQPNLTEKQATQFVRKHSRAIGELSLKAAEISWDSTCQGSDYIKPGQDKTNLERENDAGKAYKDYFNNPEAFAEAKALMDKKDRITNRLLAKQVQQLYRYFQDAGKTPELLALEQRQMEGTSKLTGVYNTYQAMLDGKPVSDMELSQRLEKSNDVAESKALWLARTGHGFAEVSPGGPNLADALKDLVKLRNETARQNRNDKGEAYSDYFAMSVDGLDIKEEQLVQLLDEVDEATREPFEALKKAEHALSMKRYGISEEEARLPWVGFGNDKQMFGFDLQPYLKGKDPLMLLEKTANAMGNTLKPIFDKSVYTRNGEVRSSIYYDPEKDAGKSQHWFSFGINPPTDARTFGSVDPKHQDMMDYAVSTLLHESTGHGLDNTLISKRVPKLLRDHHSITTESHAMLLEKLSIDPAWLEQIAGLSKDEVKDVVAKAKTSNQADVLAGCRSMLAIIQFERAMYKNSDQDFSKLWWDMQEKYNGAKRPPEGERPNFARIPHFFSHPVYYQNYFLAELVRAQKLDYINRNFGSLPTPEAGDYLKTYRAKGNTFDWDDLVERMTGEALNAKALKAEFSGLQDALAAKKVS